MENSNLMALNISNKIIEGNVPNLGKNCTFKYKKHTECQLDRNWK